MPTGLTGAAGRVTGLREAINDWILRSFMNTNPPNLGATPTNPIIYMEIGNVNGGDQGGTLIYELLDRQGMMAIWAIRLMTVFVRYPYSVCDEEGHVTTEWKQEVVQIMPWAEYDWLLNDSQIITLQDLGTDLCFMTVGYPQPVGEVSSGSWEHVVAMGVADSYNNAAVWAFLLDDWQPDEVCWRSEGIPVIADQAGKKGARLV